MKIKDFGLAFASLSNETRLLIFRLLIEYGPDGASAGSISDELEIPDSTLSFHLADLRRAGLVSSRKDGRSIIYSARCELVEDLINFLQEKCCIRSESGAGNTLTGCSIPGKK